MPWCRVIKVRVDLREFLYYIFTPFHLLFSFLSVLSIFPLSYLFHDFHRNILLSFLESDFFLVFSFPFFQAFTLPMYPLMMAVSYQRFRLMSSSPHRHYLNHQPLFFSSSASSQLPCKLRQQCLCHHHHHHHGEASNTTIDALSGCLG